jgi:hypothetical protein
MDWKEVGKTAAKFAPLIGAALPVPGGAAIGSIIASVFGVEDSPDAVMKAMESDPEAAIKLRKIELDHKERLEGLALQRAAMEMEQETARLQTVNATFQAEVKSEDKYVRRWRPTFGYAVTLTWVITWCAVVWVIVIETDKAPEVISALTATAMMWSVALAVLGVNVYKRSQDKEVDAGLKPGVLAALMGHKS